ncbi:hypothetical protein GCM10020295_70940 [Streptomyces cinereospinus]
MRTHLFQYGRTNGIIHELVARTLANDERIHVPPESIVVTTGCQEAMLLTLRALFAGPEDTLLVSSPCYVGITGAARLLDIATHPVPENSDGPDPEAFLAAARGLRRAGKRPRAVYVVPDFANPSGTSMTMAARERLLQVAAEEDLLILEDDPYGFFVRAGSNLPTLKSMDRERRVLHLGSFAKTAMPGARVGYVVADQEVVGPGGRRSLLADELSKIKSMTTVNTSAISQAVVGGLLVECDCRLREANAGGCRPLRRQPDDPPRRAGAALPRGAPSCAGRELERAHGWLLPRRRRPVRRRHQGPGALRARLRRAVDADERLLHGGRRRAPPPPLLQRPDRRPDRRGRTETGPLHRVPAPEPPTGP